MTLTAYNGAVGTPSGEIDGGYDLTTPTTACADGDAGLDKSLSFPSITLTAGASFTMSAWVDPSGNVAGCGNLFSMSVGQANYINMGERSTSNLMINTGAVNDNNLATTNTPFPNAGGWQYVGFTVSGTTGTIYVNGASKATGTLAQQITAGTYNNNYINAHYYGEAGGRGFFSGLYDEVTISNVARTADWIKLCYQNQQNVAVGGSGQLISSITCSPAAPTLSNPANGSTNQTTTPSLSWGTRPARPATESRFQQIRTVPLRSTIRAASPVRRRQCPRHCQTAQYTIGVERREQRRFQRFFFDLEFHHCFVKSCAHRYVAFQQGLQILPRRWSEDRNLLYNRCCLPNDFHTYTFNGGTNSESSGIAGNALYLAQRFPPARIIPMSGQPIREHCISIRLLRYRSDMLGCVHQQLLAVAIFEAHHAQYHPDRRKCDEHRDEFPGIGQVKPGEFLVVFADAAGRHGHSFLYKRQRRHAPSLSNRALVRRFGKQRHG